MGREHLWVRHDADANRIRVGIDASGLEELGELVYIALSEVGTKVRRGEPVGSLEAAKTTGPIVSPVSGMLVARNEAVLRDPLLVNRDSEGEGWLFEIEPEVPEPR